MWEDFKVAYDIYGPSMTHLQGKTVYHKIRHVEPIIVTNTPKVILDRYKKLILCNDFMYINGIGFLNTIPWHIMFATKIMLENIKVNNIEDGIKQVNKLYL